MHVHMWVRSVHILYVCVHARACTTMLTNYVSKLIHILPVFDIEIVQSTTLQNIMATDALIGLYTTFPAHLCGKDEKILCKC